MAQNLFGLSRNRIYQILEFTDPDDRTSRFVSFGIVGLIIVNVLAIVLESLPSLSLSPSDNFSREVRLASFSALSINALTSTNKL